MKLTARIERWPIRGEFRIARGAKREAVVLVVEAEEDGVVGRGESVPYARYGETPDGAFAAVMAVAPIVEGARDRSVLMGLLPPGAVRSAIDLALWDLESRARRVPVWTLAGLPPPAPRVTAFTLSVASPQDIAARAHAERDRPVLKLKLDGEAEDAARIEAARDGAPDATLIVDANEAWTPAHYERMSPVLAACTVALLEQPFAAGHDAALEHLARTVPVGADESFWGDVDLATLARRYDAINLKLDKTGGLTRAIEVLAAAEAVGLDIMVGCMVSTSLAVAPAMLLAHGARYIDLDGPLLLARDRTPGLRYEGSIVHPSEPSIWG